MGKVLPQHREGDGRDFTKEIPTSDGECTTETVGGDTPTLSINLLQKHWSHGPYANVYACWIRQAVYLGPMHGSTLRERRYPSPAIHVYLHIHISETYKTYLCRTFTPTSLMSYVHSPWELLWHITSLVYTASNPDHIKGFALHQIPLPTLAQGPQHNDAHTRP